MVLKQFKDHILTFSDEQVFNYGISKPFSWRGVYSEVAFAIIEKETPREEILKNIELAYTEIFDGYKGGENKYCDSTEIHFEDSSRNYTDGEYCAEWISKLENKDVRYSQEERLVKLIFN